jgi:hypothetical protein
MAQRHIDALALVGSAYDPKEIAACIVRACDEVFIEKKDYRSIKDDPAIQLMISELYDLCEIAKMDRPAYLAYIDECENHAK